MKDLEGASGDIVPLDNNPQSETKGFFERYFEFVKQQYTEWKNWKKEGKDYGGYYLSNCFLVLTKKGPHRTAPGNLLENSYFQMDD